MNRYTEQEIADACLDVGIPDSLFERLVIAMLEARRRAGGRMSSFEQWWLTNFEKATPQSASFSDSERCARMVWTAASDPTASHLAAGVADHWRDRALKAEARLTTDLPRWSSK